MACLNDEQLQALADGEGLPAQQAHAAACAPCGARLRDRIALMRSIEDRLNPPVAFRLETAATAASDPGGGTRLRQNGVTRRPQGTRRWLFPAVGLAATILAVFFLAPMLRRADSTVSASEILARSAGQLSAVTHGIELLEYELVLGGVPKEMIPDQVDGTYRIWQAIDHDVPGRFRFASYAPDGRLFSSIAEDPLSQRRTLAFTSEGQAYRFDVTLPAGPRNLSLPEIERLHMEASIAMMQGSGNQLLETIDGPNGKLYRIEVPHVAAPATNPVWDLSEARVLVDARDYTIVEFAVQGTFLKSPYTLSYKQLRHVIGASLPSDAFTVPAQPGEIVVNGEGTAVAAHDVMVLALRALAQAKQAR